MWSRTTCTLDLSELIMSKYRVVEYPKRRFEVQRKNIFGIWKLVPLKYRMVGISGSPLNILKDYVDTLEEANLIIKTLLNPIVYKGHHIERWIGEFIDVDNYTIMDPLRNAKTYFNTSSNLDDVKDHIDRDILLERVRKIENTPIAIYNYDERS